MMLIPRYRSTWLFSIIGLIALIHTEIAVARENVTLFPLDHYNQSPAHWIPSNDQTDSQRLITKATQQELMALFLKHDIGRLSPWHATHINVILKEEDIAENETELLHYFGNQHKDKRLIGFGENFRPHHSQWIRRIADNIDTVKLQHLTFIANKRAMTTNNTALRSLPTSSPHFYNESIAGEGYPFDNLQISLVYAGTPIYVLGQTEDKAWQLVVTPTSIGWIQSRDMAFVSKKFIARWTRAAKRKLMAISKTKTSILDQHGNFIFSAYVGSIFPAGARQNTILIPTSGAQKLAYIKTANVDQHSLVTMPLSATPQHFRMLLNTLVGRPYGWGGINNNNDCSQELKSLMTPFGIWLPRHSADQVKAGKLVDLSNQSPQQRIDYLTTHGKPFLTMVYIGGHIVLYIGNVQNPTNRKQSVPMTYQNVWALHPKQTRSRAVIGQSVFLPMLLTFPENSHLTSQAGLRLFKIANVDELI